MLETFLSGSVLARLINSALRLDPAARDKLAALNGRRISLDLGWGERPWIIEIHGGELHFSDDHATLCDVRLSGNLSGFLQLFKKPANSSTPPRGKLYIEGDLHAAQQFYGAVFGWQYQSWGDDYLDTGDSGIGSGLCVNETVTPPLAVIYCAQLEAAYNAVIAAGGDIVQEIFSFPGGRRFHFADPAGTEIAVWSED